MTKLTIDLDNYSKEDQGLIQAIWRKFKPIGDALNPIMELEGSPTHYFLDSENDTQESNTRNFSLHGSRMSCGNFFATLEAAQRMADRRKRIGIFENKMMEFSQLKENYRIYWHGHDKCWTWDFDIYECDPLAIYMNEENAQLAVEWANKHYPEGL